MLFDDDLGKKTKCQNPACFARLKNDRGLKVHLGLKTTCAQWYQKTLGRLSPSPSTDSFSDSETSSSVGSVTRSLRKIFPWFPRTRPTSKLFTRVDRTRSPTTHPQHPLNDIQALSPEPNPFLEKFIEVSDSGESESETHSNSTRKDRTTEYVGAAKDFGKGRTILEDIKENRETLENEHGIYYPFTSFDDFTVAAWLHNSGASMSDIDVFLRLPFVVSRKCLSFRSAQELHTKIAMLPKPPEWKSRVISIPGGTTTEPLRLFYRDGLQLFKFLFANPVFAGHQNLIPKQIWADFEKDIRIFDEPPSGDFMWEVQESVGEGETIGLVMLGSDKTHLTNLTGDKSSHCVYMSCGNISKDIRSKLTSRCWVKVAEIPVGKFNEKELNGMLNKRLYHACMAIVTATLKECSKTPVLMPDANGIMRLVRTILLSHIADNPEQTVIACTSLKASPITLAKFKDLGSATRQPFRTRKITLQQIRETRSVVNPLSVERYKTQALKHGLNCVHLPYWIGWRFSQPFRFLTPDALHQWHVFFWDHPMAWARELLSDEEIDVRYRALQKHVGRKFFRNGFTSFQQHTGRESRELQASFIAVISGHKKIKPGIMRAFRAIMDFIYIGQFEVQSSTTVAQLDDALARFHANKVHLARAGIRDGERQNGEFKLNKLELMHSVAPSIEQVGSVPQYSAEHMEHCHILMAKNPYRASNKKDYEEQVCRFLDRQEKIHLFKMYLQWRALTAHTGEGPPPVLFNEGGRVIEDGGHDKLNSLARLFLPKAVDNAFEDDPSYTPRNLTTAFILTCRITRGNAKTRAISVVYGLPKLGQLLESFLKARYRVSSMRSQPSVIDCWDRVRMQLHSADNGGRVLQPVTAMAAPPNSNFPRGLYNFVMVTDAVASSFGSFHGHFVAQLRLIFQPVYHTGANHCQNGDFLAYVEPLKPAPRKTTDIRCDAGHLVDKNSGLIRLERAYDSDGSKTGLIINLTDIWRPIDVVPNFGDACPDEWTSDTATELATEFFVNSFYEKQTYICLR